MQDSNPILSSLTRLNKALEAMSTVVETRIEKDGFVNNAEAEVQRMSSDRTRLAESLDTAQDRIQHLEHVNREVSTRLVDAMEAIRLVIDQKQNA